MMSDATSSDLKGQLPSAGGSEAENADARGAGFVLEVGLLVAGRLDPPDTEAVKQARAGFQRRLSEWLPEYRWQVPLIWREEAATALREEPVALLEHALAERDLKHWDFAIVITGADLVSYHKPYTLAALSRSLDVAVVSTSRIDPQAVEPGLADERRSEVIERRLTVLLLHLLGHLGGLSHVQDATNLMSEPSAVEDLDQKQHLDPQQIEQLDRSLRDIADPRLEERDSSARRNRLAFYGMSCWINRAEILRSIWEARPWQFPFRLSRLTIGALSTMLILVMTAEAWDLGMNQSMLSMAVLSCLGIVMTTVYVMKRQRLLVRREERPLTEQVVSTHASTFAIVLLGMTTTYALLFAVTLGLSVTLFGSSLVRRWATSAGALHAGDYLSFAALVASFGIIVGALGASFEGQHYFRHVTYVDEET